MAICRYFMHIYLAFFGLVFLQQEKPCANEIHWMSYGG